MNEIKLVIISLIAFANPFYGPLTLSRAIFAP